MWLRKMIAKLTGRQGSVIGVFDRRPGRRTDRGTTVASGFTMLAPPRPAVLPVPLRVGRCAIFRLRSPLPARTGPLELLHGRDVLVLCDVENLSLGARDHGHKVSYRRLAELLRRFGRSCRLHAFFPGSSGDRRRFQYFTERGWTAHMNEIEVVQTHQGVRRLTNSDSLILLWAGWLASRSQADLVVVASGDGSLVCDIARFFAGCEPTRHIVTLSLVGSTSHRLDAGTNPYVLANLALGRDVLSRPSDGLAERLEVASTGVAAANSDRGTARTVWQGQSAGFAHNSRVTTAIPAA